jgi:hypothetical protein
MSATDEQQGHPVSIAIEGADALPILYANAFFLQSSGDGIVVLTAAQAAPPIFSGTPEEQQEKLLQLDTISGKPLVRIAMSLSKAADLVALLQGTLTGHTHAVSKGGSDGS